MHDPRNLPDLGAINRAKVSENGGANLAAIDKKYVVELRTADGGRHRKTFDFARPEARMGPDGAVDLGPLRDFDPHKQAISAISATLVRGVYGNPGPENPPMIIVDDGSSVVWRHVVSFRFLGSVDDLEAADRALQAVRTLPEAA